MPLAMRRTAALGVTCRAMVEGDFPFTAALYASTRTEELAPTGWPDEVKDAFLAQQHEAQHRHYQAHYPGADWLIVERDGAAIGRIYIHERETDIRLIDIALLPAHRRAGIGGAMIGYWMARAWQRQHQSAEDADSAGDNVLADSSPAQSV